MGKLVAHRLLESEECLAKGEPTSRPT